MSDGSSDRGRLRDLCDLGCLAIVRYSFEASVQSAELSDIFGARQTGAFAKKAFHETIVVQGDGSYA